MTNLTWHLPRHPTPPRTTWRAVAAALADLNVPLSRAELSHLTGRGFTAVSNALSQHPERLVRTGERYDYRYTLR